MTCILISEGEWWTLPIYLNTHRDTNVAVNSTAACGKRQTGVKPPAGNEPASTETGSHRVSGGQTVAVGPLSGTIKIEKKSPYLALTRLAQVTLNWLLKGCSWMGNCVCELEDRGRSIWRALGQRAAGVSPPGDPQPAVCVAKPLARGLCSLWYDFRKAGESGSSRRIAQTAGTCLNELLRCSFIAGRCGAPGSSVSL